MNLSQDIGVQWQALQGLCSTDVDIKSLGVTEETKDMLLIKSNYTLYRYIYIRILKSYKFGRIQFPF